MKKTEEQKLFGGFKLIRATPMLAGKASKKGYKIANDGVAWNNKQPGYEVEYENGYKSWSPKDVFDKAYDEIDKPETNPIHLEVLKWFKYSHLPQHLQEISAPFTAMAWRIANRSKDGREATIALRKLLEAKDAAIRACL